MAFTISYSSRNALARGLLAGIITTIIYLLVVIITTPNFPPIAALNAAFKVNSMIIVGLAVGVGAQIFLSSYSKNLGCRINKKRSGIFGSSGSTALSSFLSFFSLVPLGCCGSWLLILSLLPSVFGSTFSVVLIQYSKPLSYLGLAIVLGLTVISALRLRKELKGRRKDEPTKLNEVLCDRSEVKETFSKVDQN
jgi:hypothetical protein